MICFFFQAEDGIRDLVRSRGLGDVYKRQILETGHARQVAHVDATADILDMITDDEQSASGIPVSYTHLTLPTIYSV